MLVMFVCGLIALLFGSVKITRGWELQGRYARFFGATLLIFAIPVSLLLAISGAFIASRFGISPDSMLKNEYVTIVINFTLTVSTVMLIALPFKRWQDGAGARGETSAPMSRGLRTVAAIGIVTIVSVIGVAGYGVATMYQMGKDGMKDIDGGTKEGSAFATGKTPKDCFDETVKRAPSDWDTAAMFRANGFFDGCLKHVEGASAWCETTVGSATNEKKVDEIAKSLCPDGGTDTRCQSMIGTLYMSCLSHTAPSEGLSRAETKPAGKAK